MKSSSNNLLLLSVLSIYYVIPQLWLLPISISAAPSENADDSSTASFNLRSTRNALSLSLASTTAITATQEEEFPNEVEEEEDADYSNYLRRNLIFGGAPAQEGVYTWFVELIAGNYNGNYARNCNGVLISGNTVVTLAWCVFDTRGELANPYGSRAAIKRNTVRKNDGVHRRWDDIRVHPDYVYPERSNNVAVIKIHGTPLFPEKDVQNINSNADVPADNQEVYIMGYGSQFNNETELQNATVTVTAENQPQCRTRAPEQLICVDTTGTGKDMCPGDEGGALWTRDNTLHGLYFEGGTCNGAGGSDAIFIRVSQFQGFITGAACELANARCAESCGFARSAAGVPGVMAAANWVHATKNRVVGLWNSFTAGSSTEDPGHGGDIDDGGEN